MNRDLGIVLALGLLSTSRPAVASNGCQFDLRPGVVIAKDGARLVVRLVNPPRTRVTLSIDDATGNHSELIWDPAVNDGLQHSVLLQEGAWTLTPSVEDERIQTGQIVIAL